MNKIFKKLLSNTTDFKTTAAGVLAIVGLFTPVSPAVIAATLAVGAIFAVGKSAPEKEVK